MNRYPTTITRQTVFERIEINPVEEIGYKVAENIVREYLSTEIFPLVDGSRRKEWVAERLQKVRQRYFEPI